MWVHLEIQINFITNIFILEMNAFPSYVDPEDTDAWRSTIKYTITKHVKCLCSPSQTFHISQSGLYDIA